jgi:trk system potassium uptake protein TrkH
MNYRAIVFILGTLLLLLAVCMLPSLMWSLYYGENDTFAFTISMLVAFTSGIILRKFTSIEATLGIRDSFLIVTLGWTLACVVGALPFVLSGTVNNIIDGLFESVSGFTTTGASIIDDLEILPHGILFWRSFTQWLGGLGIIVLFLAILPKIGGGLQLFRAEVPGPSVEKFSPRLTRTAKVLWFIYLGLTVLQTFLLMFSGFNFFDALTHTFATVATGGFSTKNLSIGAFGNPAAEIIIIIFIVVSGVNFKLYYHLIEGDRKRILKDPEFRFYIITITIATILIALNLWSSTLSIPSILRTSAFQVVSIITGTGFTTANYDTWPGFSKMVILLYMFLGGCAGSTTGAIKQIRILVLFKYSFREGIKMLHPKAVIPVKIGGKSLSDDLVKNILGFTFTYLFVFIFGSLFMSFLGLDLISAISSVAAALGNTGPGLGLVGPLYTYSHIPAIGKLFLCMCMLLGRLELYTVILCFVPEFWKGVAPPFLFKIKPQIGGIPNNRRQ